MEEAYQIKIYKICSDLGDKIYIGSTKQILSKRFYTHKTKLNVASRILFELYGMDNCKIILIETHMVQNREEQLKWEQYYIDLQRDNIVNVQNAYLTPSQHNDIKTKWREQNKEKITQFYQENKEKIKAKSRAYYEANRDKINEARRRKPKL